jgi:hypothetical protein
MPIPETFAELQAQGGVMVFLPRHRARADYSLAKLHQVGFTDIAFVEGVDGFTADVRSVAAAEGWSFRPEVKATELGHALTMLRLWRRVVDQALPYLLIFEDDVLPRPDVTSLGPTYWEDTPRDLDFIYLGNQMTVEPDFRDQRVVRALSWCTHAYIITLEGARRALALLSGLRVSGQGIDVLDTQVREWMSQEVIQWGCWNGTRLPRVFPISDEVVNLSEAGPDIAWSPRDTGLFFQNFALGSSIQNPETVWQGIENDPLLPEVPVVMVLSTDLREKLVLTYDNTALTDGVGAQLQRIYGIYSISRLLGASYLHSPLARVDYQGLSALEENKGDLGFHDEFNDLFQIKSDIMGSNDFQVSKLPYMTMEDVDQLVAKFDRHETSGRPSLVQLVVPYGIADRFPDCYEVCKDISPFASSVREGGVFRVALHVRRGEQLALDSDRMLPNAYYISVAKNVAQVLESLKIDYEIELFTEVPQKELVVQPDHHGIFNRIPGPRVIGPEMLQLNEFDELPNLVPCPNGKAIVCLEKLATADVLVMSRSSFSYVAAILNRSGVVLYHPFWHSPLSSWMSVDPEGQFDRDRFREAVSALHGARAN